MPLIGPALDGPFALDSFLDRGLSRAPDDVAITTLDEDWTWRRLDLDARRLAAGYLDHGLNAGDRLASLMPNRPEVFVHYLACMHAGLVAVPLNYRYTPPELDHALRLSGARALLAHDERASDLDASERAGSLPLGVIGMGDDPGADAEAPGVRLRHLMAHESSTSPAPAPADAPILQLFTSGSTSRPKAVTHSVRGFGCAVASLRDGIGVTDADTLLIGLSIAHCGHVFGLSTLAGGGRVALGRSFDAGEVLPLLRASRPTMMLMIPAPLYAMLHDHDARPEDFVTVRSCFSGGDAVSDELARAFAEMAGSSVNEIYGLAETSVLSINVNQGFRPHSIGTLLPGIEGCIRDESGVEVPVGAEGRLWIRSPTTMQGYWENPAATAEVIVDGWLDTGDVIRADRTGHLEFVGRQKQIIVHDGSNISPVAVEGALLEHPAVRSAGVVGVRNHLHGENVRAYVSLEPDCHPPTAHSLVEFARARVGYKAPESIVFLDEMPFNPTGKVDRVRLKAMASGET